MKQRNAAAVALPAIRDHGMAAGSSVPGFMHAIVGRQRTAPVLELARVSKRFGNQLALGDVSLDVRAGEIHALVGHNGSGKSTLVKILSGFHRPEAGARAQLAGRPLQLGDAQDARAAGLRFVHQELGLVDALSVVDNVVLGGAYPSARGRRIDWRTARRETDALLRRLGYAIDPRAGVASLSPIQRTAVAIARALRDRNEARVLVLDEPTAALPADAIGGLLDVLRRLRADGLAILYISHHLDEVLAIADRVTVLRDGRRVATRATAELDENALVELMLGRSVNRGRRSRSSVVRHGAPVLTARGVSAGRLHHLDLEVRPGEVVGVAGVDGSGRDDLPAALFGGVPRSGCVKVGGGLLPSGRPDLAIRAGLGLLGADRSTTGLVGHLSVRENLTLARLDARLRGLLLTKRREERECARWIELVDLRPADPSKPVERLSGGNQQKVLLARWLRALPQVLIIDEPTQGVDVGAVERIHAVVRHAADSGTAFVVCSSDSDELTALCDRVLVLRRGVLVAELSGAAVSRRAIDQACLADIPRPAEVLR